MRDSKYDQVTQYAGSQMTTRVSQLKAIPGRMEPIHAGTELVVVTYDPYIGKWVSNVELLWEVGLLSNGNTNPGQARFVAGAGGLNRVYMGIDPTNGVKAAAGLSLQIRHVFSCVVNVGAPTIYVDEFASNDVNDIYNGSQGGAALGATGVSTTSRTYDTGWIATTATPGKYKGIALVFNDNQSQNVDYTGRLLTRWVA